MNIVSKVTSLLIVIAALGGASVQAAGAPSDSCKPDGRAKYICGVQNVEDLIHVRNTAWVLAGRITPPPTDGGFYLINTKDASVKAVAPDFSRAAAAVYSTCPGAPRADVFSAHGIGIRYGNAQVHELYAINHNERESIEVFDLDVGGAAPKLSWKGCVVVPAAMFPNSVVPLPNGGFAATSFGIRTDPKTYEKAVVGEVSGFVAQWSPSVGWSEVAGTQRSANNGIAIGDDGKQLFVTGWGDRKLHVLSLGDIPYTHRSVDLGNMHPDNIRSDDDGKLLITGQTGEPAAILTCAREPVCGAGFKVLRVDPTTLAIEQLLDEPGSAVFGGASSAIVVGDEIWVGTFRGNRIARYSLRR